MRRPTLLVLLALLAGCGGSHTLPSSAQVAAARTHLAAARASGAMGYYLGESVGGLRVSDYQATGPGAGEGPLVGYGVCRTSGEGGCQLPVTLVTVTLSATDGPPEVPGCGRLPRQRGALLVTGVQGAYVLIGPRAVLVELGEHGPALADVVAGLRSIDGRVSPTDALPAATAAELAWLRRSCPAPTSR